MGIRVQVITLIVVTFSVTLGILLWSQRDTTPYPASSPPASTPLAAVAPPPYAATPMPPKPPAFSSGPTLADAHAAANADDEIKPPSFAQIGVPAWIIFGPSTDQAGRTLTLRNSSARPLDVSVTISNSQTGHQASATAHLPPFAKVPIDEAELLVQKGDLVTLHGPPFADRQVDTDADNAF
jgi:hypothetical protein